MDVGCYGLYVINKIKVMKTTLKKQLEAFEKGIYLDSYGNEDSGCYNFYDWFCKDYALKAKADKLFKQVKRWVKFRNTDTEKVYVFFKNNCPMSGPLYDDFRICDIETGDVIWTVTPKHRYDNFRITIINVIKNKSYEKNKCYYSNVA